MLVWTNKWPLPLRDARRPGGRRRLTALAPAGFVGAVLCLDAAPAHAEAWTLWSPAPRAGLRPLSTDRPDKTESPFTVDAGHVQVEMDLFRYEHDRTAAGGVEFTREEWGFGPVLVKLGVLHHLDVHLGLEPYQEVREVERADGETRETLRQGFGHVALRAKLNLWGNDGGRSALALLPIVQLPTAQDGLGSDVVEAGLGVPLNLKLTDRLELGAQTGAQWVGDADGGGHHFEVVNSITLGIALSSRFSGYVEFWALLDPDEADAWQGTFDFGLNFLVNDNLKLDAGLNVGVTEAAPDWNPFLGFSWRL
jgi:hypothetical protein